MAVNSTVHRVTRYSLQVLTQRLGVRGEDEPRVSVVVRLYDDRDETCGFAIFKDYGERVAEAPFGDHEARTATAYYDIAFFDAFIGILRGESELYWKIAWRQLGPKREVADVSLDTKQEIIGDFFSRGAAQ